MASCTPDPARKDQGDGGFATAFAMAVSLAIAVSAAALVVRAETDLKAARSAFDRTAETYALDAVQEEAALELQAAPQGALPSVSTVSGRRAEVTLQIEAGKIGAANAALVPDEWLASLGVKDPSGLKAKLRAARASGRMSLATLSDLDPSPEWRACAADAISVAEGGGPPVMGADPPSLTLPASVRLIATFPDGWTDDRIVRLSNDPQNPATVLDRRLYRRIAAAPACPPQPNLDRPDGTIR